MTEISSSRYHNATSTLIADDIGIFLVTIDHPDLAEPLAVASANLDVVSRGVTFIGWPMYYKVPSKGGGQKRGSIAIENVDERKGRVIRGLKGRISIFMEYISREAPDEVLWDHGGLHLRNVSGNSEFITAEVVGHGDESQPFPAARATPDVTPGVFVT